MRGDLGEESRAPGTKSPVVPEISWLASRIHATNCVSRTSLVGRVGMNFGHAIAAIALTNLLTEDKDGKGNPLRPRKKVPGAKSRSGQRGSNSFAEHPERW